jgi:hypothetical protein
MLGSDELGMLMLGIEMLGMEMLSMLMLGIAMLGLEIVGMEMIGILGAERERPELLGSGSFTTIELLIPPENKALKVGRLIGGIETEGTEIDRIEMEGRSLNRGVRGERDGRGRRDYKRRWWWAQIGRF